ncbi:MAG: hypothetical protein ACRDKE_07705, partial [Solirubrobacterales bacterium]
VIDARGLDIGSTITLCRIQDPAGAVPSTRVNCIGNTLLGDAAQSDWIFEACGGTQTAGLCRGNLFWQSTATSGTTFGTGGGWTRSNNLALYGTSSSGCPFVGATGSCDLSSAGVGWDAIEAQLRVSGVARDAAVDDGPVWPDTSISLQRPAVLSDGFDGCVGGNAGGPDAFPDVGAHEYGSAICTSSSEPEPGGGVQGGGVGGGGISLNILRHADFDLNGSVTLYDSILFRNWLTGFIAGTPIAHRIACGGDFDQDCRVNLRDSTLLQRWLSGYRDEDLALTPN